MWVPPLPQSQMQRNQRHKSHCHACTGSAEQKEEVAKTWEVIGWSPCFLTLCSDTRRRAYMGEGEPRWWRERRKKKRTEVWVLGMCHMALTVAICLWGSRQMDAGYRKREVQTFGGHLIGTKDLPGKNLYSQSLSLSICFPTVVQKYIKLNDQRNKMR